MEARKTIFQGRKVYLELLRIIAILFVIFNHTDACYLYYKTTDNPFTFWVSLIFTILCDINVPLFFMISGVLLLQKEESIRDIFRKRIMRYLILLSVFSAAMYVFQYLHGKRSFISISDFFSGLLQGNIQITYWFLYSYLGFLCLLPFIRMLAINMKGKDFIYLFILAIIFKCLIPSIQILGLQMVSTSFTACFQFITDGVFYSLMGYGIDHFLLNVNRKKYYCMWFIMIITVAASVLLVFEDRAASGEYRKEALSHFTPVLTVTVFCIVFCYSVLHNGFTYKMSKTAVSVGSYVFGIYLMEQYARTVLLPVYLFLIHHTVGILACGIYVISSFFLALGFSFVLSRIPYLNVLVHPAMHRVFDNNKC
jgi:surface polysaccharide O-acyltransferase-like enzyme